MSGPVAAALRHLKLELVVWAVHTRTLIKRRGDLKALAGHGDLRLHLGCGDRLKTGWVNIDIHPAADLRLDLRRPWPLPDGCAREVYAEHLLEHLANPGEADHLLREARRVLRTGGTLRLSVPDLARHVGAYVARDAEFRAAFAPFVPAEAVTWGDALNHHFRQHGEHLYVYDAETLEARLHAAGFVEPRVVPSSRDYEQPARDFESLVVVARNP